jgi:hypothetical protein
MLCPNRMVGVGQRKEEPSDKEAVAMEALWGPNQYILLVPPIE